MDRTDKVLATVDSMRSEIVELERSLIRIPSVTGEYGEISQFLRRYLEGMGFECAFVGKEGKPNVVGRWRGSVGRPSLALISHQDRVPVGPGWTVEPFGAEVRDGRIYGRGACDPNASSTVYLAAARALRESGVRLQGDLLEAFTVDEEVGGEDGSGLLSQGEHLKADMAIAEGRNNVIWRGYSGHMRFHVTASGKAAHGNAPWLGVSAVDRMVAALRDLGELQADLARHRSRAPGLSHTTILVGTIAGGTAANIVPDRCEVSLDVRVIPEQDIEGVEDRIRQVFTAAAGTDPQYPFEIRRAFAARSAGVPADHPLIGALQRAVRRVRGEEVPVILYHAAGDARFYMYRGMPAVCYGAGDSGACRIHGADEFIEIADLVEGTKALCLAVMDLLGMEG